MHVRMRVLAPVMAMALLALAGCGGVLGAGASAATGLEKTTINVAVVPAVTRRAFSSPCTRGCSSSGA